MKTIFKATILFSAIALFYACEDNSSPLEDEKEIATEEIIEVQQELIEEVEKLETDILETQKEIIETKESLEEALNNL